MTDEKRELLDELREAYQGLEPQERDGRLADEDALTQATVRWLQAAWSNLPVPEARPPLRVRSRLFRILGAAPAQAAAAILFVGAAVLAYQLTTGSPDATNRPTRPAVANNEPSNPAGPRGDSLQTAGFGPGAEHRGPVRLRIHLQVTGLELTRAPFPSGLTHSAAHDEQGDIAPDSVRPEALLQRALINNRRGDWSRAVEFAARVLHLPNATREQRCQALYHLGHAQQALGQQDLSTQSFCRLEEELTY